MSTEEFLTWFLLVAAHRCPLMTRGMSVFNKREHEQLDAVFAFANQCWNRGFLLPHGFLSHRRTN